MAKTHSLRPPQIKADGLGPSARRFVDEVNRRLEDNFRQAMHDPDEELSADDVVAAMTALERDAECARAEALQIEVAELRKQLNDLIASRAKRVLHVNRGPDGQIRDIVEL